MKVYGRGESLLSLSVCVCDKARHSNSDSTRSVSAVCRLSPVGTEEGIVLGDLSESSSPAEVVEVGEGDEGGSKLKFTKSRGP